ncbi:MAG: Rieske 2Fe-2S domain-containing protein [Anaerolineales bacterium]|nr:Rieske 2Fe-2S domain-containing protein [Anaerolineales bacterium]
MKKNSPPSDAYQYFRSMAEFVGLSDDDTAAIRATRFIIEKHIPAMVAKFYSHLLDYPPTRRYFLKRDGSIDQDYLQLRMHHLTNFWRRTASTEFDEDYARYVDYVGQAHTSQGADPKIYIPERYVIGQVGFVQHAVSEALEQELSEVDPDLARRASRAWNLLLMVILEMLSRAYSGEHEAEAAAKGGLVDHDKVGQLALETYEQNLGLYRAIEHKEILVGKVEEIPDGSRKIIQAEGLSIGVFHHQGAWYALENRCLHRSGPVCTGTLAGDIIACPWHGYEYDLTDGKLVMDPSAALEMYPVEIRDGEVIIEVPFKTWDNEPVVLEDSARASGQIALLDSEFRTDDLGPDHARRVMVGGERVAVYNVGGEFYATQDACTHTGGPLSDGKLEGNCVICPWHDSKFDVRDGSVQTGPAKEDLKTYRVEVTDGIGRVFEN